MHEPILEFRGQNYFLSNFFSSDITITVYGQTIVMPTGEHAFHAGKFRASNLNEEKALDWLRAMAADPHPGHAKKMGRAIKIDIDHWNAISITTMRRVQELKYEQNPALRKRLLATGNARLVEGNTWGDTLWGQVEGVGENRLGIILMELREHLRQGAQTSTSGRK